MCQLLNKATFMKLWLIGTGPHACEYAKVLSHMNIDFYVVGRGVDSANAFQHATGKVAMTGGLETQLLNFGAPERAIVSVSYDQLSSVASALIRAGTRNILLEKPGALNLADICTLNTLAEKHGAKVWVAYNRRFYASTIMARDLILEDGGVTSCLFEFTEWSHTIEPMPLPDITKAAWMIANSSHVTDLVFHFCGSPKDWHVWQNGSTSWHSASSRFCGSGITDRGVLFSYHADWDAPGRWNIELLTRKRRFIFKPMESLQVIRHASTELESVKLQNDLDINFKPGLYRQTFAYLNDDMDMFCSLADQVRMIDVYSKMAGYSSERLSNK